MELLIIVISIFVLVFVPSKKQRHARRMRRTVPVFYRGSMRDMNAASVQRCIEIALDSHRILTTTSKVDVALTRFELMIDECKAAHYAARKLGIDISRQIIEIATMSEADRIDLIRQILERTLSITLMEARALKTTQGQSNRIAKYFTTLGTLNHKIPEELHPWINAKAAEHNVDFQMP